MSTELLSSIDGRLRRICARYATPEAPAEDLYQEAAVALIEQAHEDPTFPNQTQSYIADRAKYVASHTLETVLVHRKHFPGVDVDTLEAASSQTPEDTVELAQAAFTALQALKTLSPRDQTIVKLSYFGFSDTEIADRMRVHRSTISRRRQVIISVVREVL